MTAVAHRSEHDLPGHRGVPAEAYWGIHTLRARENFAITGAPIAACPHLIDALAAVVQACREIRKGKLHDQFVVDVIQGGAGTSTNMNADEVVANRALELLGHARGRYEHLHPHEDVNLGQSTNDVCPTARAWRWPSGASRGSRPTPRRCGRRWRTRSACSALNPYIGYEAANGIFRRPPPPDAGSRNSSWTKACCPSAPSPSCCVPRPSRDPVRPRCDVIKRDPD
ncbi:Aspartate ammonia-lyase [Streptomyces sp. MA5143a]|nr:Aspartate ammonia-lyase [Streptomyces sp. MA5143a]